jgi:hypothetical protein
MNCYSSFSLYRWVENSLFGVSYCSESDLRFKKYILITCVPVKIFLQKKQYQFQSFTVNGVFLHAYIVVE